MPQAPNIDGVLITWGDRLFYSGNRVVKVKPQPKLKAGATSQRAAAVRQRIEATVIRRAPQVMVKVTGGGGAARGCHVVRSQDRAVARRDAMLKASRGVSSTYGVHQVGAAGQGNAVAVLRAAPRGRSGRGRCRR